ncbi:MAG TPA: hypothetical protein VN108_04945, partial [Marmoricola sp.]|nr:hypothetical protein [Marmoricola sp.]
MLAGVRNRVTVIFLATAVVATFVLGVALSLTLGQLTAIPRGLDHLRHGYFRAAIETVIVICGLFWLRIRVRTGPDDSEPEPPNATERGAVMVALAIVLINLGDPAYLGGILVAGRSPNIVDVVLGVTLLAAAVQFPVIFVAALMVRGSSQQVAERFNDWWIRTTPHRFHVLNVAAFGVILALAVDAGHYMADGHYLVLNSHHHPH